MHLHLLLLLLLFVEKLWKKIVVCLKTVEEIAEGERGGGCREKLKE